jgi:mono/diheme cytochrome c family protein
MKLRHLVFLIPTIALLAGCGQTDLTLPADKANELAGPHVTALPNNVVVYPDDRPSIPDGAVLYKQQCASCHSGGTGGGAPVAQTSPEGMPAATAAPAAGSAARVSFDQRWANATKPIDMFNTIAFGSHNHPKFSDKLSNREMWNLVVYTHSIGQPALDTKEIASIDAVFGSNCAVCHGTKGDGDGPLMRNLEPAPANFQRFDRFFNRTDDVLFDHIANGIRWEGMPNFLGKKDASKNITFDEAYIKKLVQYVRKFHINHEPVMTAALPAGATTNPEMPGGADRPSVGGGASTSKTNPSTTTTTTTTSH